MMHGISGRTPYTLNDLAGRTRLTEDIRATKYQGRRTVGRWLALATGIILFALFVTLKGCLS